MFRYAARLGLVGGAAMFTVQHGVWSSSTHDGAKALTDFREKVIPATNDYLKNVSNLPRKARLPSCRKAPDNYLRNLSCVLFNLLNTTFYI